MIFRQFVSRAAVAAHCVLLGVMVLSGTRYAHAQSYRDVAPLPPPAVAKYSSPALPAEPDDRSTAVAITQLRGIAFVRGGVSSSEGDAHSGASSADGNVRETGLPLLNAAFLGRLAADIGKPLTFAHLADIRRMVVQAYRDAGRPLVDVYVPEQDVSGGEVTIAVAEFRLGNVSVQGNRHFSTALLEREMPLSAGKPIRADDVDAGLALLNENPYRRVDAVYAPGAAPGTTDVVLNVDDRLPLRIYGGYNNDGVRQLGRDRVLAGLDYGNLFGADIRFGYQMTASNDLLTGNPAIEGRPNRPRFIAHAMNLVVPLTPFDSIELFGVFARSTPRLPDSYRQDGISSQISFRYGRRLPSLAGWQQRARFGYDFKRSNNDLEFGGFQVFNANTHVHQFVLEYDVSKSDASGDTRVNASLMLSPGGFDGNNRDDAFDAAQLGAKARYQYLQLSAQRDTPLGASKFIWSMRAQVQWTNSTLLPSEKLGLGGDATVRGYEPYSAQGDRGWNIQSELRSPSFALGTVALQPFLFFDAGRVWNRTPQPVDINSASLASIGAGFRLQAARFVSVRGTLGFPLRSVVPNGSKAPQGELFVVFGS
ncbi:MULTISPECIES: ShlB/FhaC/HecB family hemolysin secretion/activation protein [Burkholderia]|uniref:ShlB/FhaC/HecB family hemolysin secretion/activation protein n=1 Tax=Burkholderia TaxID=32008 RepID=UPI0009F3EB87|nr:ShlB/FhaC/HecB family hemolysin secretion/activation protein [Burkholderia sp. MSMB175]